MFAFLKGILEEVQATKVVVDVGGVGYEVTVPTSIISKLPQKGECIKLHTHLMVREDAMELYGFFDKEEKSIFEKIISVSGIGPKGAVALLSTLTPTQLALAIVTGDVKTLSSAPGIGKKTAQRMILELKEKIDQEILVRQEPIVKQGYLDDNSEVIQALTALGYQPGEAQKALQSIEDKNQDISTLVKLALKVLDKH